MAEDAPDPSEAPPLVEAEAGPSAELAPAIVARTAALEASLGHWVDLAEAAIDLSGASARAMASQREASEVSVDVEYQVDPLGVDPSGVDLSEDSPVE